jgi:DNA (cytosine-5)-methyltransferase 1
VVEKGAGKMTGGTLFSGIGAPECAAPWIDWRWCAEIEPFPSAVLAHHYPHVPNLGDVTKVDWSRVGRPDIIVWGSPCQSFSVAGRRVGIDDPRGNLTLVGLRILRELRPRWSVWENVPGVLSIDGGRTFGAILGEMGKLGYGFAYRVLDAQFFGIPQRRRRVFVVGCLGGWQRAAAVLFERESVFGNTPPSREARERSARTTAPGLTGSGRGVERVGESRGQDPVVVAHTLRADGFDASEDGTGRGTPLVLAHGQGNAELVRDGSPSLTCNHEAPICFHPRQDPIHSEVSLPLEAKGGHAVAFQQNTSDEVRLVGEDGDIAGCLPAEPGMKQQNYVAQVQWSSGGRQVENDTAQALRAGAEHSYQFLRTNMSVRRLLPIECERLQGFPDNWTAITYRGRPAADGPRYRALGNAMAVPVVAWILRRIMDVDGR